MKPIPITELIDRREVIKLLESKVKDEKLREILIKMVSQKNINRKLPFGFYKRVYEVEPSVK